MVAVATKYIEQYIIHIAWYKDARKLSCTKSKVKGSNPMTSSYRLENIDELTGRLTCSIIPINLTKCEKTTSSVVNFVLRASTVLMYRVNGVFLEKVQLIFQLWGYRRLKTDVNLICTNICQEPFVIVLKSAGTSEKKFLVGRLYIGHLHVLLYLSILLTNCLESTW